jgi:hypothetical protein
LYGALTGDEPDLLVAADMLAQVLERSVTSTADAYAVAEPSTAIADAAATLAPVHALVYCAAMSVIVWVRGGRL